MAAVIIFCKIFCLLGVISAENLNFNIDFGTFLGETVDNQLYPTSVGILSDSTILIAGNGLYDFGLTNIIYVNGLSNATVNSKSKGSILFIYDAKPLGIIKVGNRIDTLHVNHANNNIVISGSFGVAVIDASELKSKSLAKLVWLDGLSDIPVGNTCGNDNICCYDNRTYCVTGIGTDNTVSIAVVYADTSHGDYISIIYDPNGQRIGNSTTRMCMTII